MFPKFNANPNNPAETVATGTVLAAGVVIPQVGDSTAWVDGTDSGTIYGVADVAVVGAYNLTDGAVVPADEFTVTADVDGTTITYTGGLSTESIKVAWV